MIIVKIYDCKLKKNHKKWRFNQNTTEVLYNFYSSNLDPEQITNTIYNNLSYYFPHIKRQKNTKIEVKFKR